MRKNEECLLRRAFFEGFNTLTPTPVEGDTVNLGEAEGDVVPIGAK